MLNIKRSWIWIFIILAFGLRIGASLHSNALSFGDAGDYNDAAVQILQEHSYPLKGTLLFFRPPLYPFFLAILYKISFQNFLLVKVIQAIMDVMSCYFLMLIGQKMFNRRIGNAAFILAGINPFFIHWSGFLQTETLFLFLFILSVYFLILFDRTDLRRYILLSSFLLALATLTRPIGFLFIPFLFLWFALKAKKYYWNGMKNSLIFTLCFVIVIAPWTLRNYKVYKEFIPVSNAQGPVFWAGNNHILFKMLSANTKEEYRKYTDEFWAYNWKLVDEMKGLSNRDMQRRYFGLAFDFIRNNPKEWLSLRWKNLIDFWRPYVHPWAYPEKFFIISFIYLFPVVFLGLWGIIRQFWKRNVSFLDILLVLIIIIVGSSQALINESTVRYRIAIIDPFLIIFASSVIVDLCGRRRNAGLNNAKL